MAERKPSQQAIKGEARPKDDVDLATILDEAQRADLTLLVANITESMRKQILDNFDSQAGLDKSLLREGMTEDEKMMVADPANADVSAYDRERKLKEESEKDLATLKMKTLKKHVLKAYDEWREQVILRVGQVVNSERTAKEQVQKNAGKADMARPQATDTTGKVMDAPTKTAALKFKDLFPPTKTPLTKLPMDKRTVILHSVLLLLLSLEHYNAYSRVLMLNLTSSLKLPLKTFEQDEYTTAKGLLEAAKEMTADEETRKKADENKESRKWKVGLATAAGAAIIGVTGGLAAPLVAAGVGSVMGGLGLGATTAAAYLGTVAGSSVVVGGLFGAYGGRMTGQMMDNYAREVEDFQFLPVHGSSNKKTSEDDNQGPKQASDHDHKLRVTVGISGWLTEKEEVVKPWRVLGTGAEVFALKYELEALLNLGNAMNGMVRSAAWGYAQKEIIQRTIFAELAAALWPIGLLKVARVIDNPFSVAKSRAEKAGEVLADALVNRAQGERPVTLIGYSLGARVIYTCLMNLAKRKEFGIVENAVLIGSPTPSDTSDWRVLRSVVAGRLVNVFSVNDYILGFMYRTSAIQFGVAGLQKVEGLSGVENFDVSEDVNSHQRYRYLIGAILKKIGFEDIDMAAVEEEQQALLKLEEDEKKQSLLSQRKALQRRESTGGKQDEAAEAEAEADELEQQVQDQTQKSLVTRAIEYFYVPSVPSTKETEKAAASLKEVGRDPSQAGNIAGQTAQAAQDSSQSYASRLYKSLPSMPYANRPTPGTAAQDTAGQPSKTGDEIGNAGQDKSRNYVKQASSYLQSLPSSMPSFPRGSSSNKAKSQATKSPVPPSQGPATAAVDSAKSGANTAAAAAKDTAGVVSDTVTPTVRNALDPKDNPAVKSANRAADKAPIIHQAKDRTPAPVKNAAGDVSDAVGTTAQNAGQTAQKGLDTATGKAGEAGQEVTGTAKAGSQAILPGAADGQDSSNADAGKGAGAAQSYTSRAASYLPNLNVSMPSLGFGGSGAQAGPKERAKPPKLEKRPSGSRPDLTKTPTGTGTQRTGGVKSPLPKLNRAPPSGTGVKSPPPKLDRLPSGIKSPPANLERLSSGVKSPQPPKLDRLPSGPNKSASAIASPSPGIQTPPTSVPSPSLGGGGGGGGGGLASQAQSHAQSQVDKLRVGSPASASLPKLPPRRQNSNQQQQQGQPKGSGSGAGRGGASAANVLPAVPGADMLKHAATDAASETVKQGNDMLSGMGRAVGFGR
ncbi:putative membrane protein C6F6.13c [Exophiala dermatitidis]